MSQTHNSESAGPLTLMMPTAPALQIAVARKNLHERLRGHSTSRAWLPADLHPELDRLRAQHIELVDQLAAELDALTALAARFQKEDTEYAAKLKSAYASKTAPPEDDRTPAEHRAAARAGIEDRVWAVAEVVADFADQQVVPWMRRHEPELLGALRALVNAADDRRREAETLLAEADAAAWNAYRTSQWVQQTSDDLTGKQPAPAMSPAPARFTVPEDGFDRPYHKRRQWAAAAQEVPA